MDPPVAGLKNVKNVYPEVMFADFRVWVKNKFWGPKKQQ